MAMVSTFKDLELQLLSTRASRGSLRTRQGTQIETVGIELLPDEDGIDPVPWMDEDLRHLICMCLSPERFSRPRLDLLAKMVSGAVRDRNAQYYMQRGSIDGDWEADDNIRHIVKTHILDANTT